jgi:hypothetical protein
MKKIVLLIIATSIWMACQHDPVYPVKELSYTEKSITLAVNEGAKQSVVPTYTSTSDAEFSVTTNPDANGTITIDKKGIVNIAPTIAPGVYIVDVMATNKEGASLFKNALTITKIGPVTFKGHIKAIVETKCAPCHTDLEFYSKPLLINYDSARASNDQNIIRIKLPLNDTSGVMPPVDSERLTAKEIALFTVWKNDGYLEQ